MRWPRMAWLSSCASMVARLASSGTTSINPRLITIVWPTVKDSSVEVIITRQRTSGSRSILLVTSRLLITVSRALSTSPRGEVDTALATVINNLEVTNNIDLEPDVRCRVMMTSTLESFTVGHTIVMSRGLIDVVPDEASLATMLAHELSHAILGHRIDSSYAFFDQLLIDDKETFRHFGFARTPD